MTISVAQSQATQGTGGGAAGTWTTTFGSGVTAGNTLFLAVFSYASATANSSTPVYNGSAYGAATKLVSIVGANGGSSVYTAIWMFPNIGSGGGTTVGATSVNGTVDNNVGSIAYEVSGLGTTPTVDLSSTGQGTSGNISSGATGNINFAPEFVLGSAIGFAISLSSASGFTNLFNTAGGFCEAGYQIPVSSGSSYTYAANTGVSAAWADVIVTVYAPAATGVAGTVQPRATVPVPRRRPARAVVQFTPVVTVNTGHGPAGRAQPLAASLVAPRRKPARAVVQFTPVTTTNAPAKAHPAHGIPASDEARGWKKWLLWGP